MKLSHTLRLRISIASACLVTFALCVAGRVAAGPSARYVYAAVHVVPHGTSCKSLPPLTDCYDINTTYIGTGDIDVIPVFFNLWGFTAIDFGLTWPSEWGSCSFVPCGSGTHLQTIVNPGDGEWVTWPTCQSASWAHVGYGWLAASSQGEVAIAESPRGNFGILDCSQQYSPFAGTYAARVGWVRGDIPWACMSLSLYPPDAAVTDDVPGPCIAPGDTVNYLIVFTNNSQNVTVHNVAVLDSLPVGTQYLYGGTFDPQGNVVRWTLGTIEKYPDNQDSVSFAVRVTASYGSIVTQRFVVTGQEFWPFPVTRSTQVCSGPADVQPTTWGSIKALFR